MDSSNQPRPCQPLGLPKYAEVAYGTILWGSDYGLEIGSVAAHLSSSSLAQNLFAISINTTSPKFSHVLGQPGERSICPSTQA